MSTLSDARKKSLKDKLLEQAEVQAQALEEVDTKKKQKELKAKKN